MEIKDFVEEVLVQLDSAVEDAREKTKREIYFTGTSDRRTIEFDIAVTTTSNKSASGKAGLKVIQFVEAGGQIEQSKQDSTVSRIMFGLNISGMTKEETRDLNNYM